MSKHGESQQELLWVGKANTVKFVGAEAAGRGREREQATQERLMSARLVKGYGK
jgi:hypothetical protein